ncbi:MAG: ABC transporter substrate-binding protein [Vicinamibacterales bacterium]
MPHLRPARGRHGRRLRLRQPLDGRRPRHARSSSSADATTLDYNTTAYAVDSRSSRWSSRRSSGSTTRCGSCPAERWRVAEDGRTWTFALKPGIVFHDGTPSTRAPLRRTSPACSTLAQGHNRASALEAIERVDVVDDRTVRIVTKHFFGAFEPTMAHVSAAIVEPGHRRAVRQGVRQVGRGDGRHRAVSRRPWWKKDLEVVLERNERYWGAKGKLRQIVYRPIPEAASRVIALESGDGTSSTAPPADLRRSLVPAGT